MAKAIPQLIDGEWRGSRSRELIEVTDPATQDVFALAPKATADEIEQAIASAQRAFETWREVPAPERARLMLRYQHLLKEHHDELGELLARETGKNLADAKGDVWRGIEVVDPPLDLRTSRQAVAPVPTDGSPTKPWRNTQSIAKRRSTPRVAVPYPAFLGGGHGAVSTGATLDQRQ
mgnify:CR=1 FL=1